MTRGRSRWWVAATSALLLGLVPAGAPNADASTFDIFGSGARDIALGGAVAASARGVSGLYYNPAVVSLLGDNELSLGMILTAPALDVERGSVGDDGRPTVQVDTHVGLHVAYLRTFGGIFRDRLAMAVGLYLPTKRLIRVQGVDPQSPQFYLYQNLQDKLVLQAAVAWQPIDGLSIGAGVQILADVGGRVDLELDILGRAFDRRNLSVALSPTASPVVGVHVAPMAGLSLGLTYRGQNALEFGLPVRIEEGQALTLDIDVEQVVLWSPHQVALGVAYQLEAPRVLLEVDLTWAGWSAAPDPSPQITVDVGGRLVEAFGLADAIDVGIETEPLALGFVDTWTLRAGVEWRASETVELRGGYVFRPTPAPRQTGATAYLDNDAHIASLGAGFRVVHPLRDDGQSLDVDLAAQLTILRRRVVDRPAGDPVGSFTHGGAIWGASMQLSYAF